MKRPLIEIVYLVIYDGTVYSAHNTKESAVAARKLLEKRTA